MVSRYSLPRIFSLALVACGSSGPSSPAVLTSGAATLTLSADRQTLTLARGDTTLAHYAQWLDGVVMHGGADVWPGSYGEEPLRPEWHGDRVRDAYEIALVRAFGAAGKPVFGICRGLQLINVAHGGTLYQDIATQRAGALVHRDAAAYDLNFHEVDILPGTRLARVLPPGRHKINSVHHQGVKELAPGFEVEAVSPDDGVIEAIRHTGGPWIAAVQWHPELHRPELGVIDDTPLLRDFLDAARAAREQRSNA